MRKAITVIAVVLVLVLIGAGAYSWLSSSDRSPIPESQRDDLPGLEEITEPDWCPDVEIVSTGGTWESWPTDDPFNPTFNPNSFMLSITGPLQAAYDINDVRVWTTPYTAQFKNINSQGEMSYDESRAEGTARVTGELRHIHQTCPSTDFILMGFSQGAVITGDVADQIGGGQGVIPAEKVRGVALIADGRREPGVGVNPGVEVDGIGAEISLQPVSGLIQFVVPGATMTGERPNGFGALADRTYQICAPEDSVCDAPYDIGNGIDRAMGLVEATGIHAQYASNPDVIPGTTTTQWAIDWAHGLINQ
ncbi:cutinase family protein [Corynebacterium guangdongense]|uniref:Cutinase n=1 Tax=Corynebacterium guangdongense TaxID=1783348 RepID=A0ABU2A2Z7_9CORY|nr:cutinase family protein [Corynebacterium guangdongense]MDR7330453.1 hypothetical protein [Corynebacterium guangdongense]WJZ19011.1 Cutinase [Corynebacterium guangdongense]